MCMGCVFDVQRFSLNDGPGIRTTVFLKGCPLQCRWCHNPESKRCSSELLFDRKRCLLCGACVAACSAHCHTVTAEEHSIDRSHCHGCGACAAVCPTGCLESVGKERTVEDVLEEVMRDAVLYERSLNLLGRGYPFPLLYNDDVNVPAVMRAMDVSRSVAEQYSFFGCGEFMLDRRSIGTPNTALNIAKVLELTLFNGVDPHNGERLGLQTGEFTENTSFEELVHRFKKQIDFFCRVAGVIQELIYDVCAEEGTFLQASLLLKDCSSRGKGFLDGGIHHLGGTVETYGMLRHTTVWWLSAQPSMKRSG